ncbi:MAG: preprotein translocase subunit SecG [Bacteroidales bacterium]|nr:preprotein translocase subunit SecG [Bacteroidales bacterium]
MIYTLVIVLTIIAAILLIGVVLIQKSKGGGLGSTFASSNSILGVKRTNDVIEKITWWLAGIVCVLSIVSVFCAPALTSQDDALIQEAQQSVPAANIPAMEVPAVETEAAEVPAADAAEAPAADAPAV